MELYLVLITGEGGTRVEAFTKDALRRHLDENYWGKVDFVTDPNAFDTRSRGQGLIWCGCVCKPVPKQVVQQWDVEECK